MKFLIPLAAIFVICHAAEIVVPKVSGEVDETKFQTMLCNNGTLGPSAAQGGRIQSECLQKYGSEPGQQNPNCLYFCQSEILGLLNSEGLPTRAHYDRFVEVLFPKEHREMGLKWFLDCYEKYGKFVDKTDTDCKIAGEFNTCTWSIKPKLTCSE